MEDGVGTSTHSVKRDLLGHVLLVGVRYVHVHDGLYMADRLSRFLDFFQNNPPPKSVWLGLFGALSSWWCLYLAFGEFNWSTLASGLIGTLFLLAFLYVLRYIDVTWLHRGDGSPSVATEPAEPGPEPFSGSTRSRLLFASWIFVMLVAIFGLVGLLAGDAWLLVGGVIAGAWSATLWLWARSRSRRTAQ
jgi:hypothetical protein